jgi:hypothetical protein
MTDLPGREHFSLARRGKQVHRVDAALSLLPSTTFTVRVYYVDRVIPLVEQSPESVCLWKH